MGTKDILSETEEAVGGGVGLVLTRIRHELTKPDDIATFNSFVQGCLDSGESRKDVLIELMGQWVKDRQMENDAVFGVGIQRIKE